MGNSAAGGSDANWRSQRLETNADAVQSKVEAIHRYQAETQQEIEAMTGAVLERAFRGQL